MAEQWAKQAIREGGIPFDITLNEPSHETVEAMLEEE